uniref:Nudix hydrolase 7-like n=1 Tax=Rhizophora mucronata TaxID=61149 RepID=A0A2P2LKV6_RHIMU
MEALSKGMNMPESIGSFISTIMPPYESSTALSNSTCSIPFTGTGCSFTGK